MSNILTALSEFRKILVDFKGLLQADVNRASGVILPSTPSSANNPQLDVEEIKQNAIAEYIKEKEEEEEEEEKDKEITAAEVGAVVGVVGVLGYFAAKAADLLD